MGARGGSLLAAFGFAPLGGARDVHAVISRAVECELLRVLEYALTSLNASGVCESLTFSVWRRGVALTTKTRLSDAFSLT
jgi:hypothetical protein